MNTLIDTDKEVAEIRKRETKRRIAMIAAAVIIVMSCVVVIVKKHHARVEEELRIEAQYKAENEARQERIRQEEARRAEEARLREIEYARRRDSIAALPKVEEPQPPKPEYTWDELEKMVRDLTNEEYYASVWRISPDKPEWVVIYHKGGNIYFRHFNPAKKTYGAKVRLKMESVGKYYAAGNKRDRYVYGNGGTLIHEVNGVEKESFYNRKSIDLYTPEPVPDGYDDWEDYYYDNEEDFLYYYGR